MNQLSGIYRKGTAYPLNTRMRIVASLNQTNSVLATATQCRVSEMTEGGQECSHEILRTIVHRIFADD